jgi:hypothetical protein
LSVDYSLQYMFLSLLYLKLTHPLAINRFPRISRCTRLYIIKRFVHTSTLLI